MVTWLAAVRTGPRHGFTRDKVFALTTALTTVHTEPARGTLCMVKTKRHSKRQLTDVVPHVPLTTQSAKRLN